MDIKSIITEALNSNMVQDPTQRIMLSGLSQLSNEEILAYIKQQLQLIPQDQVEASLAEVIGQFPPELQPQMKEMVLNIYNFLKTQQELPTSQ
jgi:hypothetical protein